MLPAAARAAILLPAGVRALAWTGRAEVATGKAPLQLDVDTRVEPFVRARSRSWLRGRPETARTMVIEPEGGSVERGGTRTALPPAQTVHERQQFGLYGYMLRASDDLAKEARDHSYREAGFPPIDFHFASAGLGAADYTIDGPEGGKIAQRILFEGLVTDQGIRWPRSLTIVQDGKPWFKLVLDRFSVELA